MPFSLMTSWNPALKKTAFFYQLYQGFCTTFLLFLRLMMLCGSKNFLKKDFCSWWYLK